MPEQSRHRRHIRAARDQQTRRGMPEAVDVQMLRQAVLFENLLEPVGERRRRHRKLRFTAAEDEVIIRQRPPVIGFRFIDAIFVVLAKEALHFLREVDVAVARLGFRRLDDDVLMRDLYDVAADVDAAVGVVDVMDVTGQLCLLPPIELPNPDDALEKVAEEIGERLLSLNLVGEVSPPEIPWQEPETSLEEPFIPLLTHAMLLEHYGVNNTAWEEYKKVVDRFERYLLDAYAFIISIRNFIRIVLPKAARNDAESYAESLYMYYNDDRLIQKLMVGPLQNYGVGYTLQDRYVLSYVPRLLPDDTAVIAQEHITDSVQAILKADYMLALNSGHQIRRCVICERFFLLKSGVHALYCEGACPHAPRFTCRQFGTHEVQKELAKDIPKVRAKLLSFERITKDMRRGNITREEARKAKGYVRDALYDALRDPNTTLEDFEERVSSEHVYSACHIKRAGKPRGRPKKTEGEA